MNCNSAKNILEYLQNAGFIDNKHNIVNDSSFKDIQEYLDTLKPLLATMGIDPNVKLFSNVNGVLQPNTQLFSIIDSRLETSLDSLDYDSTLDEKYNETLEPEFESLISYKKNLLNRLNNRLAEIKNQKNIFSSDPVKLKELTQVELELVDLIEGNENEGTLGVKEELVILGKTPTINKMLFYAEKDLNRLEQLVKSNNIANINEAQVIIKFYQALGTFDAKVKHPMFDEVFNDFGDNILPQDVQQVFSDLAKRATESENILKIKHKQLALDIINNNKKVKAVIDKPLTFEEAFSTKDGLRDINYLDMFLMDTTNSLFSNNGIVPQVMMSELSEVVDTKKAYAVKKIEEIDKLQDKVSDKLTELGHGYQAMGIKGVSYDIFRAKDKNGLEQDIIIQRYSSTFREKESAMQRVFNFDLKNAYAEQNPSVRDRMFTLANNKKRTWLKNNVLVVNVGVVKEIQDAFPEFKDHFSDDGGSHAKKLKDVLGKYGYKEEIDKQIKSIKDYKAALEIFTENQIASEGVKTKEDLSLKGQGAINRFEKTHSPFHAMTDYYKDVTLKVGNLNINPSFKYTHNVPRKNKVTMHLQDNGIIDTVDTQEETGFYDDNFKTIEEHPELKEFHTLMSEITEVMANVLPADRNGQFTPYSIPALKKNLIEILANPETAFMQKISDAYRFLIDKLVTMWGEKLDSNISFASVDPITGLPDYRVNDTFLKDNGQEINKRLELELLNFHRVLGIPLTTNIRKSKNLDISQNTEALSRIGELLGVKGDYKSVQNFLHQEDLKSVNIADLLRKVVTHEVVRNNSIDMPKLLKTYLNQTMLYAARQESLPYINMLKEHYNDIKNPSVNRQGISIINEQLGLTRLEGLRNNANAQMESWLRRAVLGDYRSKNEFGNTKPKLTPEEAAAKFKKRFKNIRNAKVYTLEEGNMLNEIINLKDELSEYLKNDGLSESQREAGQDSMAKLLKIEADLGKNVTGVSVTDTIFDFIRFKGLGWNLSSYVTNFLEGQSSNFISASSGIYFTPENIFRAVNIVQGSFLKNMSFGKVVTPGAKKTRTLMDKFDILQDASNELQKASVKSSFNSLKNLSPFEGVRRVEYLNQAPLMIAVLLDIKIKGKDGKESNVWDALDEDGLLIDNFATEENKQNWERAKGEEYSSFKNHMTKTIVNIHGDYDTLRGTMASETITGKATLMFKRWFGRQIYQRFAMTPQRDIELGMDSYRGRYFSHTPITGATMGALVGFAGAGPVGALLVGAVGAGFGKHFGDSSGIGQIKELSYVLQNLVLTLGRIPINSMTGKDTIKQVGYSEYNMDPIALKQYKANMTDLSLMLAFLALQMFVKATLWDDDDEKETKRMAHNLLINRLMQLSSQANQYINPVATYKTILGENAPLRFLGQVFLTATKAQGLLNGTDQIGSGVHAGESKTYNQFKKTFYPGIIKDGLGFGPSMERQFQPTATDSWFWGAEKKAQKTVQVMRRAYKQELLEQGYEPKEAAKLVRETFRAKSPDETYQQLLMEFENL